MFNISIDIFKDYVSPYLKWHDIGLRCFVTHQKNVSLSVWGSKNKETLRYKSEPRQSCVSPWMLFLASDNIYVSDMETDLISSIGYRACKIKEKY